MSGLSSGSSNWPAHVVVAGEEAWVVVVVVVVVVVKYNVEAEVV